jgi:uncharacterized membrane protein
MVSNEAKLSQHLIDNVNASRDFVRSLKAEADEKRSLPEKVADGLTAAFGSMWFLAINVVWFVVWIVLNLGLIPSIKPFDPFPFGLLTMVVSLEAIGLAIIVLISQNRSEKVADLRGEVDLQLDILTERELTKMLKILIILMEKNGIDVTEDSELHEMLKNTNIESLEEDIQQQMIRKSAPSKS